jgi:hypothetical protein
MSTPRFKLASVAKVVVAAAIALAIIASPERAWADEDALPITVVAVKSDDALDQAEALTQALRKAVRDAKGWSLGEGNQSLEFLALQMKCEEPIDAACEARIADVIKADRFIWCVVNLSSDGGAVEGELNLFVRGKGTSKATINYSANLADANDDALIDVANTAISEVTGGPPKGGLKVTTGGIAGQLYVDDKPIGALPEDGATFQLPAGSHRVVVKSPGYADAEGTTTVKPATTVELSLTLVETEEVEPIDGRMIGGFIGIGVGLAGGAVGLWQALEVNSIRNDDGYAQYASRFTDKDDVCDQAAAGNPGAMNVIATPGAASAPTVADQCDKANTAELIQAIAFPTAAVAAGVGFYLLGTSSLFGGDDAGDGGDDDDDDDDDEPSALTITPIIAPGMQAVSVGYRF